MLELDIDKNEFSEDELDMMIDVLEKAEAIKEDGPLFKIVKKRMGEKVKSIKSMEDLRSRYNQAVSTEDRIKT